MSPLCLLEVAVIANGSYLGGECTSTLSRLPCPQGASSCRYCHRPRYERTNLLTLQVRTASCGATACVNSFGDEQLAVDLLADKLLFEALRFSVSTLARVVPVLQHGLLRCMPSTALCLSCLTCSMHRRNAVAAAALEFCRAPLDEHISCDAS